MDNMIDYTKGYLNKKILITGSSGYIASAIINELSGIECTLYRMSRSTTELHEINNLATIVDVRTDFTDTEGLEDLLSDIDIIFHMAAQTSSFVADKNPMEDFASNVRPLVQFLTACERMNVCPSIIFAGTVTEIGLSEILPVNEKHYEKPITVYDIHKLCAEKYLEYYSAMGKVKGCTLRLANVYGPGKKSSSSDRGILNLMIRKAIDGDALTVYGEGNYLRDYTYIDDVVNAFLLAAVNIDSLKGGHYIIGNGESFTISKVAHLISDRVHLRTEHSVPVDFVSAPSMQSPIETRNFVADTYEFTSRTGWHPKYQLQDGIDRTIDLFLR